MGSLIRSVFGGSSSKQQSTSESGNKAYDKLSASLDPSLSYVSEGGNALASLLGLRGGGEQAAAQANFRNTPGYDFARSEGLRSIMGQFAGNGSADSGAAMKSLSKFTTGLADQTYQDYLKQLLGFTNIGSDSARTLAGAGQYSKGQSTGSSVQYSGGLGKALGFGIGSFGNAYSW